MPIKAQHTATLETGQGNVVRVGEQYA